MKKGKIIVTITIGIMCFILTALIFMQVKTISQTGISELEIMRESELKTEITSLKTRYDETIAKIEETNEKILEYEASALEGKEASELLQQELKETDDLLGKNSVTGEGIIITLANSGTNKVYAEDLLELVNLLKNAGAEAISINEQRIVYDSYIVDLAGNYITVNGERIVSPFTVKAIGNTSYLESAVAQKNYGYIDTQTAEGKQVALSREASITIAAHNKSLEFEYVREGESYGSNSNISRMYLGSNNRSEWSSNFIYIFWIFSNSNYSSIRLSIWRNNFSTERKF